MYLNKTIKSVYLKREVVLYIMLPKNYDESSVYPVLYMHDGQNLFDKAYYSNESWGVYEAFRDHLLPECIVVGINSCDTRSDELVPVSFNYGEQQAGGNSVAYYDFITKELVPYIDQTYKTISNQSGRYLMGSSFGGVSTTYAMCKHNDVFSRFGLISNAYFVIQDYIEDLVKTSDLTNVEKVWMDVGDSEASTGIDSQHYVLSNNNVFHLLQPKLSYMHYEVIVGGKHSEVDWNRRIVDILTYLLN